MVENEKVKKSNVAWALLYFLLVNFSSIWVLSAEPKKAEDYLISPFEEKIVKIMLNEEENLLGQLLKRSGNDPINYFQEVINEHQKRKEELSKLLSVPSAAKTPALTETENSENYKLKETEMGNIGAFNDADQDGGSFTDLEENNSITLQNLNEMPRGYFCKQLKRSEVKLAKNYGLILDGKNISVLLSGLLQNYRNSSQFVCFQFFKKCELQNMSNAAKKKLQDFDTHPDPSTLQ